MANLQSKLIIIGLPVYLAFHQAAAFDFSIRNVGEKNLEATAPEELVLTEYSALHPPELAFKSPKDIDECTLDNQPCELAKPLILRLAKTDRVSRSFALTYKLNGAQKKFTISLLDKDFPVYEATGTSSLKSNVLFTPINLTPTTYQPRTNDGRLLALNPDGSVLYYRKNPGELVTDFRPHRFDEKIRYSYLVAKRGFPGLTLEGPRVFLDEEFQPIQTVDEIFDMHDAVFISSDHYFRIKYEKRRTPLGGCMLAPTVYETKGKKTVYELSTHELLGRQLTYVDFFLLPYIYEGEICREIFHLNTIQVVDRERLLLGFLNSIVMYNRQTKKVEWVFGGPDSSFFLPPGMRGALFHTAIWEPATSTLTYLRNRTLESPAVAVNSARLDLKNKDIISFETVFQGKHPSIAQGSVSKDGDAIFSVYLGLKSNEQDTDFREIVSGKEVFSIRFLPGFGSGYRAYRAPAIQASKVEGKSTNK